MASDNVTSCENNWFNNGVFNFFSFSDDDIVAVNEQKDRKLTGVCNLCKPAVTAISGRRNVTSNFIKHLRVSHHAVFRDLERQKNRKRGLDSADSSCSQPKQQK